MHILVAGSTFLGFIYYIVVYETQGWIHGVLPFNQCFWAFLPKNNNSLCHNCPTHLSHKCPAHLSLKCSTHLSHNCPIPISHYVLTSHYVCVEIFHIMNIDVPAVLVLPHSTHNLAYNATFYLRLSPLYQLLVECVVGESLSALCILTLPAFSRCINYSQLAIYGQS